MKNHINNDWKLDAIHTHIKFDETANRTYLAWLTAWAKCNHATLLIDENVTDIFSYVKESRTMAGRDSASTIVLYNKLLEHFSKKQNILDMISTKKEPLFSLVSLSNKT